MRYIQLLVFLGVFGVFRETPAADSNACEPLRTPDDVIRCALANHPDIQRAGAVEKQGTELEAIARQRPNPELSSKVVYGRTGGATVLATESALLHTFELGGKRGARVEGAVAASEERSARLLQTKEEVFLKTWLALYRMRQVRDELKILDEGINTFERIQRQFRSRPRLGPEQSVSLSVFRLAQSDFKLRKATLLSESNVLQKALQIATGKDLSPEGPFFPSPRRDWPAVPDVSPGPLGGSRLKLAEAELKEARAAMSAAEGSAWPDLKIGPAFETQRQGAQSFETFGVTLSLPLPLYQANAAGKAYAALGENGARLSLDLAKKEAQVQWDVAVSQYRRALQALNEALPAEEVERKHESAERLFIRGLVPSALVIEAHRQIFDFTKSFHEREIELVEALSKIRALEGRLLEENP